MLRIFAIAASALLFTSVSARAADACAVAGVVPTAAPAAITALGSENLNGLQLVWNPDRGEYLAVWNTYADSEHQLYVRRLHADGTPVAEAVRIAHDPSAIIDPQVAAAAGHDAYLVVWQTQNTPFNGARGLRLDGTAAPVGEPFVIATDGAEPALAYVAATERFLFTGRGAGVTAQYVGLDGALDGEAIALATLADGAPAPNGSLGVAADGRALATWRDQDAETLAGRGLDAAGAPAGPIVDYGTGFPASDRAAHVAWRAADDRFVVLYSSFDGTQVAWLGAGADGAGSTPQPVTAGEGLFAVGVGLEDELDGAVLAWAAMDGTTGLSEVRAQLLASDGTLVGTPVPLADGIAIARNAHLAVDRAHGTGLLVWPELTGSYARPFAFGCLVHDAIFADGFDG
jgi:hypothetical protein